MSDKVPQTTSEAPADPLDADPNPMEGDADAKKFLSFCNVPECKDHEGGDDNGAKKKPVMLGGFGGGFSIPRPSD